MVTNQIERKTKEIEAFSTSTLEVEIENHSPSIAVVRVSGEVDPDQADYLTRQLKSATKQDPRFVILDLAGLTFISRAALAHLEVPTGAVLAGQRGLVGGTEARRLVGAPCRRARRTFPHPQLGRPGLCLLSVRAVAALACRWPLIGGSDSRSETRRVGLNARSRTVV
jgi:hypothetical protein